MLTRGCDVLEDPDWEEKWHDDIKRRTDNKSGTISVGWEETVTLGAYAVNIKNITTRDQGQILKLIAEKYASGATSKKIWEFPAVRAVINYHWDHWARRFLLLSAFVFLAWLISFVVFLYIYIDYDANSDRHGTAPNSGKRMSSEMSPATGRKPHSTADEAWSRLSHVFNILSLAFMIPFGIEEVWTILKQRRRWIQPVNILDISAIGLQTFIFFCHSTSWHDGAWWFSALLATQCVFLFAKLQNFGRVLGAGASFSEIFLSVLFEVRFLLGYTILSCISAALCLRALYKDDQSFAESKYGTAFDSVPHSLVTTFQIIFGSFETAYVFDANHNWLKLLFFLGFQILMSITILNLFIAVMTESYTKFAAEQGIRYNRGRASVIDELDSLGVPNLFADSLKPYIHFLVVEKKVPTTQRPSLAMSLENTEELKKKVERLTETIENLVKVVSRTTDQDVPFSLAGPSAR